MHPSSGRNPEPKCGAIIFRSTAKMRRSSRANSATNNASRHKMHGAENRARAAVHIVVQLSLVQCGGLGMSAESTTTPLSDGKNSPNKTACRGQLSFVAAKCHRGQSDHNLDLEGGPNQTIQIKFPFQIAIRARCSVANCIVLIDSCVLCFDSQSMQFIYNLTDFPQKIAFRAGFGEEGAPK